MSSVALTLSCSKTSAAESKTRNIPVGYTEITWDNDHVQDAIETVASLDLYGFEAFGDVLARWEGKGGLSSVLERTTSH
jgi:hypothetical protein